MAETIKVLGAANPGAVATVLYTVPAAKAAVVSMLSACNTDTTTSRTMRVAVNSAGGAGQASPNFVAYELPLNPTEVVELLRGATLQAGATVVVYSSANNINFNLFGVEIDV